MKNRNYIGLGIALGAGIGSAIGVAIDNLAMGIGMGDDVIVPSHTFIATAEAVCAVGANPIFADVSQDSHVLTAETVSAVSTPNTRAIIPVHIYGFPCPMFELLELAEENSWFVIEDCAQAHCAKLYERPVGSFGDAATFSFYPGKNLGALGDAGLVAFRKIEWAGYARKLSNHGRNGKYEHDFSGYNFRMDELQAAMLLVKLPYIERWNDNRRVCGHFYTEALTKFGFKLPKPVRGADPVYHLFVVEVANRDLVLTKMKDVGIKCGVHYPIPCHIQKAMVQLSSTRSLPISEEIAQNTISLPICGEITQKEAERVVSEFLKIAEPIVRI